MQFCGKRIKVENQNIVLLEWSAEINKQSYDNKPEAEK